MFFYLFLFAIIISCITATSTSSCLGIKGACDLRLDEVTLAGAHNAGAGFDGHLYYHNPYLIALSCPYRSQIKSVTAMLNAGIRYLDIDLCYEHRSGYEVGVWTCHNDAYGGPMSKFLKQVNEWLHKPENKNEIVVLHFNRDHEKGEREDLIGKSIVKQLKNLWNPSYENIKNGKVVMQSNINAKIGDSIKENRRVYVFLHSRLQRNIREDYLYPEWYVGYTWLSMGYVGSDGCKNLVNEITDRCPKEAAHKFVRLDLYLSWGLCIDNLASSCNRYIGDAALRCYNNIQNRHRTIAQTVNFIVVDYATENPGIDSVKTAKEITERYIKHKN